MGAGQSALAGLMIGMVCGFVPASYGVTQGRYGRAILGFLGCVAAGFAMGFLSAGPNAGGGEGAFGAVPTAVLWTWLCVPGPDKELQATKFAVSAFFGAILLTIPLLVAFLAFFFPNTLP